MRIPFDCKQRMSRTLLSLGVFCVQLALAACGAKSEESENDGLAAESSSDLDETSASSASSVEGTVAPLDDGCTEPVCHVTVRLDGPTLRLRGFAVSGGPLTEVDAATAAVVAGETFDTSDTEVYGDPQLSGPRAGLYTAYVEPGDFGAFALVGAESGLVVAAGTIVWAGAGRLLFPVQWQEPTELELGDTTFAPSDSVLAESDCSDEVGTAVATASDALDVVLRSNLAAHFAGRGEFTAFSYLYTPTVGLCDPTTAEYVVVLTRRK
jgi:hypothetical protein